MSQIMVTGANGFVGAALCGKLVDDGYAVRAAIRSLDRIPKANQIPGIEYIAVGEIDAETDWREAIEGIETVVHLAARVHVMKESASDPLAEFRRVNRDGSENLAQQCAAMDINRLVYVSTVKVSAESTQGIPLCEDTPPTPSDPYAISKWEAEQALRKIAEDTGLELVIVRPPLVYGPGVRGNFIKMLQWVDKGIPLPLGGIKNHRSLVGLRNLADFLALCATKSEANGEVFFVSDGDDVSTSELLRLVAASLNKPYRMFPFSSSLLRIAATLLGQGAAAGRLLGSLQLDISNAQTTLGWRPRYSLQQELEHTCEWYLASTATGTTT